MEARLLREADRLSQGFGFKVSALALLLWIAESLSIMRTDLGTVAEYTLNEGPAHRFFEPSPEAPQKEKRS